MDYEIMTGAGAEGTADTGAGVTESRTGEQMLMDAFADHGSANSGEVADPANADEADDHDPDGGDDTGAETDGGDAPTETQSKEENAVYAKARRQAEAKLQREREKFESEKTKAVTDGINAEIAALNLYDPNTGKQITDAAGLKAYRDGIAAKRMEQAAQSKGMTSEELKQLVELHPDVAAAKAEREANARAAQENARLEAQNRINADVAEIGKLNPAIKTFSDIRSLDRFPQIYDKIKRGYSVIDAYRTEYSDAVSDARVREAEQRVRNGTTGKAHMQTMTSHGEGAKDVPNDEVEVYRRLMGVSDADARKALSRFHK